jgi:hypothetical protein
MNDETRAIGHCSPVAADDMEQGVLRGNRAAASSPWVVLGFPKLAGPHLKKGDPRAAKASSSLLPLLFSFPNTHICARARMHAHVHKCSSHVIQLLHAHVRTMMPAPLLCGTGIVTGSSQCQMLSSMLA